MQCCEGQEHVRYLSAIEKGTRNILRNLSTSLISLSAELLCAHQKPGSADNAQELTEMQFIFLKASF